MWKWWVLLKVVISSESLVPFFNSLMKSIELLYAFSPYAGGVAWIESSGVDKLLITLETKKSTKWSAAFKTKSENYSKYKILIFSIYILFVWSASRGWIQAYFPDSQSLLFQEEETLLFHLYADWLSVILKIQIQKQILKVIFWKNYFSMAISLVKIRPLLSTESSTDDLLFLSSSSNLIKESIEFPHSLLTCFISY